MCNFDPVVLGMLGRGERRDGNNSECPLCQSRFRVKLDAIVGEPITCPNCGELLEVVKIYGRGVDKYFDVEEVGIWE